MINARIVLIMPRTGVSFDNVRQLGLALPGVEESTAYGMPALKIRGKLLATLASHKSAEPNSLVVRVNLEDRAELLAADSAVYYMTNHYQGFDGVLVRLAHVRPEALQGLLGMAHKYVSRQAKARPSTSKR
jgi:hypothetical protein